MQVRKQIRFRCNMVKIAESCLLAGAVLPKFCFVFSWKVNQEKLWVSFVGPR